MGFIGTLTDIDNSILDGSVQNKELQNCTVSYGGISLSLGGVCSTPQFNLINGYNYSAGCLSGGTLNSGVTASSLTSVGSLTSLDVVGVATFGSNFKVGTATTLRSDGSATFANGDVGIGTDNPGRLLHLFDIDAPPLLIDRDQSGERYAVELRQSNTTDGNAFRLAYQSDTTGVGAASNVNFASIEFAADTHDQATRAGSIRFRTSEGGVGNEIERLRITSGGSVGIGTTNPTKPLDVQGKAQFTDTGGTALVVGRERDQKTYISLGSINDNEVKLQAGSTGTRNVDLLFHTSNSGSESEKVRITSGGLVGIGTDNPDQTLHLYDSTAFASFTNDDDTGESGILFRRHDNDQNRGKVTYSFTDDALLFRASSDGSGEDLRITSGGDVGIGSTQPTTKLDVDGSATFSGSVTAGSFVGKDDVSLTINNQSGSYVLVAGDSSKLIRESGSGTSITVPASTFSAGNTISIFNVSSGNISIIQGVGVTMYNTADGSTGNRTLGVKGMCTLICTASNEFVISGGGLV